MSELQDNILDDHKHDDTDLESLLAAATSSEFSMSDGFTAEKQEFEKLNSFFDIVTSKEEKNLDHEKKSANTEEAALTDIDVADDPKAKLTKGEEFENDLAVSPVSEDEVNEESAGENTAEFVEKPLSDLPQAEIDNSDRTVVLESLLTLESDNADASEFPEANSLLNEAEKIAYDAGYKEALEEFEKAMELEKNSFKDLTETMFSISDDFREKLEDLIKTKICELSSELFEGQAHDISEALLKKIKTTADNILVGIKDFRLELNHADFELLKTNDAAKDLGFDLIEMTDLRRGEFRIISDSTGFQQELSH
jgi:flagellar biosynthesis/type III secretory pathway protein FliH